MRVEKGAFFAAEVHGIDLSLPVSDSDIDQIVMAMDQHAVLIFRQQCLDQHQLMAFARRFGPLDAGLGKLVHRTAPSRLHYEELADIANVLPNGELMPPDHPRAASMIANRLWHSDSSFQSPRAKYSMLSALVLPSEGGETEFASLHMAYEALPRALKRELSGLVAVHYALNSRFLLGETRYTEEQRRAIPPARWPLIQTDPRSGRKMLYVGAHASQIEGMGVAEGRMLLWDLLEHATQRMFVYRHEWQVGDLVMWDNTATVHRGRRYDTRQRRELRRATTLETRMSPEAEALEARVADAP